MAVQGIHNATKLLPDGRSSTTAARCHHAASVQAEPAHQGMQSDESSLPCARIKSALW